MPRGPEQVLVQLGSSPHLVWGCVAQLPECFAW